MSPRLSLGNARKTPRGKEHIHLRRNTKCLCLAALSRACRVTEVTEVMKVMEVREAFVVAFARECLNASLRIRLMNRNCDSLIRV